MRNCVNCANCVKTEKCSLSLTFSEKSRVLIETEYLLRFFAISFFGSLESCAVASYKKTQNDKRSSTSQAIKLSIYSVVSVLWPTYAASSYDTLLHHMLPY